MDLEDLKGHWKIMRKELDALPRNVFISDNEREDYQDFVSVGKCGWLKGENAHVQDGCISWPFYWESRPILSNCAKCPETFKLLSYHLGLKCPDDCYLHHWNMGAIKEEDGKHITLNTKYPHWAENKSKEDRVILYIEICHPDQTKCSTFNTI